MSCKQAKISMLCPYAEQEPQVDSIVLGAARRECTAERDTRASSEHHHTSVSGSAEKGSGLARHRAAKISGLQAHAGILPCSSLQFLCPAWAIGLLC